MTPEQFCYWLRGVFEIQFAGLDKNAKLTPTLTGAQISMINQHLDSVFKAHIMQAPASVTIGPKDIGGAGSPIDFSKTSVIC